jgi:hypothetical protein
MALSTWWLFNTALGNGEGLLVAAALWAIAAQLAGRWRAALALGVAAALMRSEVWPFLGLYVRLLWRVGRRRPWRSRSPSHRCRCSGSHRACSAPAIGGQDSAGCRSIARLGPEEAAVAVHVSCDST